MAHLSVQNLCTDNRRFEIEFHYAIVLKSAFRCLKHTERVEKPYLLVKNLQLELEIIFSTKVIVLSKWHLYGYVSVLCFLSDPHKWHLYEYGSALCFLSDPHKLAPL